MILKQLVLTNYGVYSGRQTFDFRPEPGKPIVIVGGKNGAGKTTLLDAIRLCLYGQLALDQNILPNKATYHAYLRNRVHHIPNALLPITHASVELEFEYAQAGVKRTYRVKREWELQDAKNLKEWLHIYENGLELDVDAGQWQDFLKDLVPPGLSQLFFFDGEKIQSLASDDQKNPALSKAIKSLLGINIIEQLHTDLAIYRRRQQKSSQRTAAEHQIEQLEDELAALNLELEEIEKEQNSLIEKQTAIQQDIEIQESEVARLGGGFAKQREDLKVLQFQLEAKIEQTEQQIRELCAGLLPFSIAAEFTESTRKRLLAEAEYRQWEASKAFIENQFDSVESELADSEFWENTPVENSAELQNAVGAKVKSLLQKLIEPPDEFSGFQPLHQVSEPEQQQLLRWIDESLLETPKQLQSMSKQLVDMKSERRTVVESLRRVPSDEVLAPLVKKLNELNQQMGALNARENELAQKHRQTVVKRDELQRQLHRMREVYSQNATLSERIKLILDVDLVLDDFSARLTDLRVRQLGENFTRNFNLLTRKEQLIKEVAINENDFSISLIREDGNVTPKNDLSAGEKQIYAIAMLWALRQVSGRPLPVIIDTPLGRLDSSHRKNLIEKYFPHASHQVILFSTDTEVDIDLYAALQPYIARTYHLDHDETTKSTHVKQGYFWSLEEVLQ